MDAAQGKKVTGPRLRSGRIEAQPSPGQLSHRRGRWVASIGKGSSMRMAAGKCRPNAQEKIPRIQAGLTFTDRPIGTEPRL